MEEIAILRKSCLQEAKQIREEMLSKEENGWNSRVSGLFVFVLSKGMIVPLCECIYCRLWQRFLLKSCCFLKLLTW